MSEATVEPAGSNEGGFEPGVSSDGGFEPGKFEQGGFEQGGFEQGGFDQRALGANAVDERFFEQSPRRDSKRSLWKDSWPTFSWLEGVGTVTAGAVTGVLWLQTPPDEPRWRGGVLFDDAVRDGVRLKSADARKTARTIGDWPYFTSFAIPLVIDPLVVLTTRGDAKSAANLELISLEAFSYAGALSFVSTRISIRERPDSTQCFKDHPDGEGCERDTEAFWSGHTTITAASAGLVCANHQYLALWGHPVLDGAACVLASSGALVTGTTRMMADRHYASDVIVGMGIGFAFGYGVPTLLHYTRGRSLDMAVTPHVTASSGGLQVAGVF